MDTDSPFQTLMARVAAVWTWMILFLAALVRELMMLRSASFYLSSEERRRAIF